MPRISVIICTHNRATCLRGALKSLIPQTLHQESFEVLVVDNNSSDSTPQIVQDFRDLIIGLRYIHEKKTGLSQARNRGLAEALSPYVAYMDDDARAEPQWIEKILNVFENMCLQPDAVGGRVFLDWGGCASPKWLPGKYESLYSGIDWGEQSRFLKGTEYLVGTNMAFRKEVLLKFNGFLTDFERRGTRLSSGEETDVLNRIKNAGGKIYYEPSAVIWHTVLDERKNVKWLQKRIFWDGASQPLFDFGINRSKSFYAYQTYIDLRRMGHFAVKSIVAILKNRRQEGVENLFLFIQRLGRCRTSLLLALGMHR